MKRDLGQTLGSLTVLKGGEVSASPLPYFIRTKILDPYDLGPLSLDYI
jgi:hypothetical protein